MALATRCPFCSTTFRVVQDQLKLRAGLVRCGACREIFNGAEHLIEADKPASTGAPSPMSAAHPAPTPAAAATAPFVPQVPTAPADVSSPGPASADPNPGPHQPAPLPEPELPPAATTPVNEPAAETAPADTVKLPAPSVVPPPVNIATATAAAANVSEDDPMQRMTLMDFTSFDDTDRDNPLQRHAKKSILSGAYGLDRLSQSEENPEGDLPDDLTRAVDELQRKPWRSEKETASPEDDDPDGMVADEPEFVKRARRQQTSSRAWRLFLGIGSAVLLIVLLLQGFHTFRNQIAASLPMTAPALGSACELLGCRIELPAQIDAVSIESSELQALATIQNSFLLTTVLRNRSATAQQWPNIELTLNDANEKPVARRVFLPRDYLPRSVDAAKGFAANLEQTSKLTFVLSEMSASGYRVELFYP